MKSFLLLLASVAIQTVYANTGAIPLTHDQDLWYGTVQVGTPAKALKVVFDTGSADFILPRATCGSSCSGHTLFAPLASSTSQDLGRPFSITFAAYDSSTSGELFTDTVHLGGLTANAQTIAVANQYSVSLEKDKFPADGLLGLAFESISVTSSIPVFGSLVRQGVTTDPLFAFKLSTRNGGGSELFLGGTNPSLFTGPITYTPVLQHGFWQVNLEAVAVGGTTVVSSHQEVIIDTGSPLIILPMEQASRFYAAVPGSAPDPTQGPGYYTVSCGAIPSMSLTFNGRSFLMNPDSFNMGPEPSDPSRCGGAVVGHELGPEDFGVVGTAFLQNVYSVFDLGKGQVGFATLA